MKKLLLLFMLAFTLSISAQTINQPSQFNTVCDDNNDGFATFLMFEIGAEISGSSANLAVTHHLTQADAANGVNPLPSTYTNTVNPQLIFARVVNLTNNQVQIITYNLTVNPLPIANPQSFTVCDNDNNGITLIDLNLAANQFYQGQNYTVFFYETLSDAQMGTSMINPNVPYFNITPFQQTLHVRVTDLATGCTAITQLYLIIVNCNGAGQPVDLYACSNGTSACFDLHANDQNIIGSLVPNDYEVTYYTDSALTNLIANSSNYCISASPQTIYAKLTKLADGTFQIFTFNLVISIPPPAPTQTITQCLDSGFTCWDLTSVVGSIANGQNCEVYFYTTQQDAFSGTNPITTPNCFTSVLGSPTQPPLYYSLSCFNLPGCTSIGMVELITVDCSASGQPESLVGCVDGTNNVCFDLTVNDDNVMGTLNPANHTVSYHLSQADATSGANPITANPYCMPQGFQMLFSRIQTNAGDLVAINSFSLNGFNFEHNLTPLQTMVQCDDNNDQNVVFDLTTAQAQINTTNTLTYYASSTDAQNEQNPITTPTAYSVSVFQQQAAVFIRESIVGACDIIYTLPLQTVSNCNLAAVCIQANSLCNALGVPFSNSINTTVNEPGAYYGCLNTHPNPTWFYMPISSPGQINLTISQTSNAGFPIDVDYIVYGPFTSPTAPCYNQLTPNYVVSCSYSASAVEYPMIPNTIAGQYYLIMVTNFSNQPGLITITQQGGNQGMIDCSGFHLNAFLDSNNNGSQDNGEPNFPLGQFHYEVNNSGTVHNITAPSGNYNIYDTNPANSYDISYSINPAYTSMYNVTTSSYNDLNVVIGAGMITYNFPVTVVQPYNDLAVTVVPISAPRPGFTYTNRIVYTNLGNQNIATGTVTFTKDSAVSIVSISQAGTTASATGFTYNFSNLNPFEVRTIDVVMQVPPVPTVNAGDYLTSAATITPLSGDVVLENNVSSVSQMVINAYDPNDKSEAHGDKILHSSFSTNDYLYYTIRFENTGNASAINVRVEDVLDAQLDESTVQMVSASHSYVLDRVGSHLIWKFDNIQLPVSVANSSVGKGYITFKVKPNANFAIGDIIPNTAAIYFDFNPAIVTNTFTTEFTSTLVVDQFGDNTFMVYPNPASSNVTIVLQSSTEKIENITIVDIMGKIVATSSNINSNQYQLNVEAFSKGMYMIEISTNEGSKATKKLVIK
ncbi:MAG: T9SS type A sorting domain-containing protein [Flavobacterium sp.]|nr:T9SS type A sorting domain-containing protein [Flavobacterium sp.]